MARFLTPLDARHLRGDRWRLTATLTYDSDVLGQVVLVPKGFITDFASVPRLPLIYLVAGDTVHEAAVIHDWLYGSHESGTKAAADGAFLEAMTVTRVPAWRRWAMYGATVLFGGADWESGPKRFRRLNPRLGRLSR